MAKKMSVYETRPMTKNGKRMGTRVFFSDDETGENKVKVLLTPAGKGRKYAQELRTGCRVTNAGHEKHDEYGRTIPVSEQGKAYRAGYLDAQKDAARAWKSKKK